MAGTREQASEYLQRLEADIEALRAQLEKATTDAATAEVRAVTAEARAKEYQDREEALKASALNATQEAAVERSRSAALESSIASERLARIESDKRVTELLAEVKNAVPQVFVQPAAPPANASGYDVVIARDSAENLRGFSITPRTKQ